MESCDPSKKLVEIEGYEPQPYDVLERDFQEVLEVLVGDRSLERFRAEYEKIYRVLRKSHDNEKRLLKRCRELNGEIVANAAKVQTALKLSEEDQVTIAALKKELEKAWKLVDEAKAKETILQLKSEMGNLTKMLEDGMELRPEEEATIEELVKTKDALMKERDELTNLVVKMRNEAVERQEKLKQTESERESLDAELHALRDEMSAKKAEFERESRKKERNEKEMKEMKQMLENRQFDIKQKQAQIVQCEETIAKLEQMVHDSRQSSERVQKEYNHLNEKVLKLHHDLEEQIHTNTQLLAENSQKQVELKAKDEEIGKLKADAGKAIKTREQILKKLKTIETEKSEIEDQRDIMKSKIFNLEKEIDLMRKQLDGERKKQDEMLRERDILNKLKMQAEKATQNQMDTIKIHQNTSRNLEHEIQGYKLENQKQTKMIFQLEQEREKCGVEANEAARKYAEVLEEVRIRELKIIDLQTKISEGETKLKQQQNMYEAIRADRNMYSKNLIGAQDSIQELKRKFKIMTHQIEQLKEEISSKELALLKEHFDHMKVQKEKEALKAEVAKLKENIQETEQAYTNQKIEFEKLNQIIQEADRERGRQLKEYELIANERDILGTQLVRRNDELALLYEKLKIQQTTLSKGQVQYTNRVNEIRLLRIKLTDLQREQHLLKSSVSNVELLKKEVHHLSRELMEEKTKVKALGEELEHPLNVHRWRKLEGSDPTTYELIRKVQTLQKRLILKTEEVVEKDMMIREKEKLYCELKQVLARQPGPEAAEQLSSCRATLRDRTKQLKAMTAEANMYRAQMNEHKYEIARLEKELNATKAKYFEKKREEQIQKQKNFELDSQLKFEKYLQPKIIGGGFSMVKDIGQE